MLAQVAQRINGRSVGSGPWLKRVMPQTAEKARRVDAMKVGVIGAGAVGRACTFAMLQRGSCREIVLVNRTRKRAAGVAGHVRYGRPLSPPVDVRDGDYADLAGAALVIVTVGENEQTGGAADRDDPRGRLRLLDVNVPVYRSVVPQIVAAAPEAVLIVVTDPPDPLTDITLQLAGHERVFGTGTLIDSLRLRVHIAQHLGVDPAGVDALVVGEHGTSSVTLWSSATVAGVPVADLLARGDGPVEEVQDSIERDVRFANITIIEGIGASQYGIGIVAARLTEAVLRDEGSVFPVTCHQADYGVSLSLPCVIGRSGVARTLTPRMSGAERDGLLHSADVLRQALQGVGD
jgi:L-lactate dehydrogenase